LTSREQPVLRGHVGSDLRAERIAVDTDGFVRRMDILRALLVQTQQYTLSKYSTISRKPLRDLVTFRHLRRLTLW
jgi:hypothetical protein